MPRTSAGILPYRVRDGRLEVFLVHPGGPFWSRKNDGAWSIAKGEFEPPEEPLDAARREFHEETGFAVVGDLIPLAPRTQPGGKVVAAWAVEADYDPRELRSNTFVMEWPKGSGRHAEYPEVDRAEWFELVEARKRILPGQLPILEELATRIDASSRSR